MLKKVFFPLAFIFGWIPVASFAQSMIIDFKSIADQTDPISGIQNLTFDSGAMTIHYKDGSDASSQVETIQKIYFGGLSATNGFTSKQLTVYPNPSSTEIRIDGLSAGDHLMNIYQIDGKRLINKIVNTTSNAIDVSALPAGIYFLTTNGFNAKFIKL